MEEKMEATLQVLGEENGQLLWWRTKWRRTWKMTWKLKFWVRRAIWVYSRGYGCKTVSYEIEFRGSYF